MHVERLTASINDPFDQRDLEEHVRVPPEDRYEVTTHARAAASELQHYASLALLTQTVRVTLSAWPGAEILPLPIAPVVSGASVTVTDDGAAFTGFELRPGLRPALRLTDNAPLGEVVIEYEAGFGTDHSAIPHDLRLAILDQATAFFDGRGPGDGRTDGMSPHMARIAARYRRVAL